MKKQFYSVNEAAELCGVSRMTISRWLKSGKISAETVGRTKLIPVSELSKCSKIIPDDKRQEIEAAVRRVVEEYGETLKLLAKE